VESKTLPQQIDLWLNTYVPLDIIDKASMPIELSLLLQKSVAALQRLGAVADDGGQRGKIPFRLRLEARVPCCGSILHHVSDVVEVLGKIFYVVSEVNKVRLW
jgi:hypothetical protein